MIFNPFWPWTLLCWMIVLPCSEQLNCSDAAFYPREQEQTLRVVLSDECHLDVNDDEVVFSETNSYLSELLENGVLTDFDLLGPWFDFNTTATAVVSATCDFFCPAINLPLENPVAPPNSTIQNYYIAEKNGFNVTVADVDCYEGFQMVQNISWIFQPTVGFWQWVEYKLNISDAVCQLLENPDHITTREYTVWWKWVASVCVVFTVLVIVGVVVFVGCICVKVKCCGKHASLEVGTKHLEEPTSESSQGSAVLVTQTSSGYQIKQRQQPKAETARPLDAPHFPPENVEGPSRESNPNAVSNILGEVEPNIHSGHTVNDPQELEMYIVIDGNVDKVLTSTYTPSVHYSMPTHMYSDGYHSSQSISPEHEPVDHEEHLQERQTLTSST